MQKTKVVIIGGGFGGMFTAKKLQKICRGDLDIELISKINYFTYQPLLPEVAAGTLNPQDAVTPLRNLLKGVHVRLAEVTGIDLEARQVVLLQGQKKILQRVDYDHLVIATGQVANLSMFPGFEHHSLTMKDLSDAYRLRNHVIECMEMADVTRFAEIKQRALTFVVAGGGFSGVETIGELAEMIERILPQYPNIARHEVRMVLIQRDRRVLPEMPERLSQYALKQLEETRRRSVAEHWHSIGDATSGVHQRRPLPAHPHDRHHHWQRSLGVRQVTAHKTAARTYSGKSGTGSGRARERVVDWRRRAGTAAAGAADPVYAPPTAQFAAHQAGILAQNIVNRTRGQRLLAFNYTASGIMASLGGYRGVAEIFGMRVTGLLAWLIWRVAYIGMLPGIATRLRVGLDWLFDYFMPRTIVYMAESDRPATRYLNYRKGEVVQYANEVPAGFYIVVSGCLEQQLDKPDGEHAAARVARRR